MKYRITASLLLLASLALLPAMGGRVKLQTDAPVAGLGRSWPLYCGIPLPKGELTSPDNSHIVDLSGNRLASQVRVMARWPGSDSIRWLGVDFQGNPTEDHYFLFGDTARESAAAPKTTQLLLERGRTGWVVTTGPARFVVPEHGPLLERAWLDSNRDGRFGNDELLLQSSRGELYLVDQHGRLARSGLDHEPDQFAFEPATATGSTDEPLLHLTIRREGWYTQATDGERFARHITRLHFYAGQPFVRIEHTLVLTRNTTPGSYAERRQTAPHEPPLWFREVGITFGHTLRGSRTATFANNAEEPAQRFTARQDDETTAHYMFQERGYYYDKIDPDSDCRFEIGSESGARTAVLENGKRCGDWSALQARSGGVALGVRHLWQQYPKELRLDGNSLTARLWSPRGGRSLDFRLQSYLERWPPYWFTEDVHGTYGEAYKAIMNRPDHGHALGMAKSHELQLLLLPPGAAPSEFSATMQALSQPAATLADPAWLYRSEAMSPLHHYDAERFPQAETYMRNYFTQYSDILDTWGDYGFLDFGARPHVWYRKFSRKDHQLDGRWIPYLFRYSPKIDYGFSGHLWRMYARSGFRDYLDLAEITARHRMDIYMAHWDEPKGYFTNQRATLYGKYCGGFTGAMNAYPWGAYTILHFQSGTELRHLYWYYYLRDYRRAHDVSREYHQLVKKLWQGDSTSPFTGTRPFATLKNLSVLYQETADPEILEIGRFVLEKFVDLNSPQGVTSQLATGLAKYTTKIGAVERWYEATGDELAKKSILHCAETYARTSLGNPPNAYYNIMARVLNRAWRISGDPLYVRTLKRNMEYAVELNYDAEHDEWHDLRRQRAVSASNTAYPVGDMAIGMDAVRRAGDLGPVPLLQQRHQGRPVIAIMRKVAGTAVTIDLRGHQPLRPRILTLDGKAVNGVEIEPFRRKIRTLRTDFAPNCFMIRLPAALPSGDYLLDAGVAGGAWEITWSDAPGLVLYAPGGLAVDGGPASFFKLPSGLTAFEVYNSARVPLFRPDGQRVAPHATQSWERVTIESASDDFWRLAPWRNRSFIELRGFPLLLTSDPKRWFLPDVGRIPLAQLGMRTDYSETERGDLYPAEHQPFVPGVGAQGQALALNKRRLLEIKAPDGHPLLDVREGTFELWLRPNWSNVYGATQNYLLTAKSWHFHLNYVDPRCALMRLQPANSSRRDLRHFATLERGQWHHLAWQWLTEADGRLQLEMYLDGILCSSMDSSLETDDDDDKEAAADAADGAEENAPAAAVTLKEQLAQIIPPASEIRMGHHHNRPSRWGSLDGVIDNVRFSNRRRYQGSFTPVQQLPLDQATLALFRFDGDLTGLSGTGQRIEARLVE